MAEADVLVSDSELEDDTILPKARVLQHQDKIPNQQGKIVELQSTDLNLTLLGKKQYPFINEVRADKYSFYCTICKRNVKCGHMGLSNVRHVTTSMHQRYAKDARSQTILSFQLLSSPVTEKVNLLLMLNLSFLTI